MQKRPRKYSGTTDAGPGRREKTGRQTAAIAAAEGIVLLKNDGHVLPLARGSRVALFGGGACRTVKGGIGSGDVNARETVTIAQGMQDRGFVITTMGWLEDYGREYEEARKQWKDQILKKVEEEKGSFFEVYSAHPFAMPSGRAVTGEDMGSGGPESGASDGVDTAVYVVSRIAGEAKDRCEEAGDYYLTEMEHQNLRVICGHYRHVVLILNTGSQMDLSYVEEFGNISSILYLSQPGMEGGHAVADILCGGRTPCGKLSDTWARRYRDYPVSATFSHNNGNVSEEYYEEGIYVGYRYFDSFGVRPQYGFGFGLSYTRFDVCAADDPIKADVPSQKIMVRASVKNTGNQFRGKEVAQVYVSCPQTGLHKEFRRLCGFSKTALLGPGEETVLEIAFPVKAMASYQEEKHAWTTEAGLYGIWIGDSLDASVLAGAVLIETDSIIEKTRPACPMEPAAKAGFCEIAVPPEKRKEFEEGWHKELREKKLPVIPMEVREETVPAEPERTAQKRARELTEKLTRDELIAMVTGEISKGQSAAGDNALGAAGIMVPGAAGETSGVLEETYGVPGISMADGPAGLRLAKTYEVSGKNGGIYPIGLLAALEDGLFQEAGTHEDAITYCQYCTAIPVGTLLAQTWDVSLMEQVGMLVAAEMQEFGISWWLAPGMNLHRDPLCGRNFEYYSEDPVLSGLMAAAITRGVQSGSGTGTAIKHFACNNQEDNRKGSDSILSERVLRELYLRGFEIAVKTSQPMAIMTSYNKINGVHAANSYDLCTRIAREEWGFQGIIMTDWTTTSPQGGSIPWKCIAAGNDLIMPGCCGDVENLAEALDEGLLSMEELKACVRRLLTVIYQSGGFREARSYGKRFEK